MELKHDTSTLYSTVLLVSIHRNHHRAALLQSLTFREPCIVIYSYNKTNEMHYFLKFIFGIELYMFQTGFLSIIRSLVLYDI